MTFRPLEKIYIDRQRSLPAKTLVLIISSEYFIRKFGVYPKYQISLGPSFLRSRIVSRLAIRKIPDGSST